jgi:hypothetical protein
VPWLLCVCTTERCEPNGLIRVRLAKQRQCGTCVSRPKRESGGSGMVVNVCVCVCVYVCSHAPRFHVATRTVSFLRGALCLAPIAASEDLCSTHHHCLLQSTVSGEPNPAGQCPSKDTQKWSNIPPSKRMHTNKLADCGCQSELVLYVAGRNPALSSLTAVDVALQPSLPSHLIPSHPKPCDLYRAKTVQGNYRTNGQRL